MGKAFARSTDEPSWAAVLNGRYGKGTGEESLQYSFVVGFPHQGGASLGTSVRTNEQRRGRAVLKGVCVPEHAAQAGYPRTCDR